MRKDAKTLCCIQSNSDFSRNITYIKKPGGQGDCRLRKLPNCMNMASADRIMEIMGEVLRYEIHNAHVTWGLNFFVCRHKKWEPNIFFVRK